MLLSDNSILNIYREMNIVRCVEERIDKLISMGDLTGTTHLGIGHEAIIVGINQSLRKTDYFNLTHRMHGLTVLRGDMKKFFAELHGREAGYCKGRGGSTHMIDMEHGNIGCNGIVGSAVPVCTGMALAFKMKKTDDVILCTSGDGMINEGAVHEGFNLAAVWELPIVFLCENNQYAMSTPLKDAFAIDDLSVRAKAYGFPGYRIDGNKVDEVIESLTSALEHARSGKGPVFIVAETYRLKGHSKSDMQKYRSKEEVEEWRKKDPLLYVENILIERNLIDEEKKDAMLSSIKEEIEDAVKYAQACPFPDTDTLLDYVFTEPVV